MKFRTLIVIVCSLFLSVTQLAQAQDIKSDTVEIKQTLVNINTANVKEIESLPGIGKVKAQAIVSYRDKNGQISSFEDLIQIKGLGKKSLAKLEGKVSF